MNHINGKEMTETNSTSEKSMTKLAWVPSGSFLTVKIDGVLSDSGLPGAVD